MPRGVTLEALADLAEQQQGLFTRRQAEATGMAWTTLSRLVRDGAADRVAHGVYRLRGTPPDEHIALRVAWLQLAPDVPVWERSFDQGVVSHRSAAAIYGLGHLPADGHEFTVPVRRQSRRHDVHLHRAALAAGEWTPFRGLLVTRPSRTAADLLAGREDSEAVAQIIADALRGASDTPGRIVNAIGPFARRFGLRSQDGLGLFEWLLNLTEDVQRGRWLEEARR